MRVWRVSIWVVQLQLTKWSLFAGRHCWLQWELFNKSSWSCWFKSNNSGSDKGIPWCLLKYKFAIEMLFPPFYGPCHNTYRQGMLTSPHSFHLGTSFVCITCYWWHACRVNEGRSASQRYWHGFSWRLGATSHSCKKAQVCHISFIPFLRCKLLMCITLLDIFM